MALYARAAGGNWNTIGTWSTTSSAGASSGTIPANTDDVIFDAGATATVTVNATTCVCKSITCQATGNKLTISNNQKLTVSGAVTFFGGMTLTSGGTGALLQCNTAATLTSGTNSIPFPVWIAGTGTYTMGDSWTCAGGLSTGTQSTTGGTIINGNTITVTNYFYCGYTSGGTCTTSGTTAITLGTGATFYGNGYSGGRGLLPLTIAGNVSIPAGYSGYSGNITYSSGTVTVDSTSTFYIGNSLTMNVGSNVHFKTLLISTSPAATITLSSDLYVDTALNSGSGGSCGITGAFSVYCAGACYLGTNAFAGTSTIRLTGSGTNQMIGTGITNPVVINTAGTYTFSTWVIGSAGSLTYTAGAINASSVFYLYGSATLNCSGTTLPTVQLGYQASGTLTLSSNLNVTNLALYSASFTTTTSGAYTITMTSGTLSGPGIIAGTAEIVIAGTGNSITSTGTIKSNLTFNCTTTTANASFSYSTGTLKYTAGTLTFGAYFVNIIGSCTLDLGAGAFNLQFTAPATATLTSAPTALGILSNSVSTAAANPTFSGNYNISCTDFEANPLSTWTFVAGQNLNVSTYLYLNGTDNYQTLIKSSSGGSAFNLNYAGTLANMQIYGVSFKDTNAAGSAIPLWDYFGTLVSGTTNILVKTNADFGGAASGGVSVAVF